MATVAGAEREDDGQAAKTAATFSSAASLILSFSASLQPLQQQPLCLSASLQLQLLTNKVDCELLHLSCGWQCLPSLLICCHFILFHHSDQTWQKDNYGIGIYG